MKAFVFGAPMDDQDKLLESAPLEGAQRSSDAEVVLYQGDLDSLFQAHPSLPKARVIMPVSMFIMNNGAVPVDLSGQNSLGKREFENEDIRKVSDKISEFVDMVISKEHFSDMARFMKANAIELVQNALIHKRLNGKQGAVELEIFETSGFYNARVTDPFGALEPEEVISKLARASLERTYETKKSGAGLGLRMVVSSSDCVVFQIKKGESCQVCCIINKYKRLKQFKNKSPALFIFNE